MTNVPVNEGTSHTEAYEFLYRFFHERESQHIEAVSRCGTVADLSGVVMSLLMEAISDYSDYGRELTVAQSKFLGDLVGMIDLSVRTAESLSIRVPTQDELSASLQQQFGKRIKERRLKKIVHAVFSSLGLYEIPRGSDLPQPIAKLDIDGQSVVRALWKIAERLDILVERHVPSKPQQGIKPKMPDMPDDVLRILQETLGTLHSQEMQPTLEKSQSRIENLLKRYGISLDWAAGETLFSGEEFAQRYDSVVDPECSKLTISRPCLLQSGQVLLKGEVVAPRQ